LRGKSSNIHEFTFAIQALLVLFNTTRYRKAELPEFLSDNRKKE